MLLALSLDVCTTYFSILPFVTWCLYLFSENSPNSTSCPQNYGSLEHQNVPLAVLIHLYFKEERNFFFPQFFTRKIHYLFYFKGEGRGW